MMVEWIGGHSLESKMELEKSPFVSCVRVNATR